MGGSYRAAEQDRIFPVYKISKLFNLFPDLDSFGQNFRNFRTSVEDYLRIF